ncbi:MAG: glycosyl transferase [Chloroflexi bacterium]|nr:MAG: glycosyl transferase [Chloroflexota bacterium]
MKALQQSCVPRSSCFDPQRRDTVLDLGDLIEKRINPAEFFAENYMTEGMRTLLEQAFRRLEGKSEQGVFKLKQAMGGGKTHNLLTLGLLAQHPAYREAVLGHIYRSDPALDTVRVVAFSGRESDAPLGIWGAIAEQLGKREHFKDCYTPLQAPGQKAWENLLAGETVLILLDELPPYFQNASARAIGNSDLAQVTATALSNLLIALGKDTCRRVCLVITDLAASYEKGSAQISSVLADFEKETHRTAMSLEPVRMNSDELYHILRTRLFERLPSPSDVSEVAQAYAKAIRSARQMDITNESPEQFAARIESAYPFHPAIRDLYARFRENPGFQQTRGLIRLMRIVVARLWQTGAAGHHYLIAAHDIDLNDRDTRAEVSQINNALENAIAHDIADEGRAVAEVMDDNLGNHDTQDACRLLLMASLPNVPNAVVGLSIPELVAYLCAPERDLSRLKGDVLEKLATAAWYLHSNRDGKLFFKNVQNLNAKLESLVKAYAPEQAVKELRERLSTLFHAEKGWCYQRVLVLPALDEIELDPERVTLVITEPHPGVGLSQDLRNFFAQATWKNRVAFLTGVRNTYDQLIDIGKRLKAIQHILTEQQAEKLPPNDPLVVQANGLHDIIQSNFYFAVRETFTRLFYPLDDNNTSELRSADLAMKFEGNRYNGEDQIIGVLKEKQKYTDDIASDTFRKKCEQRLFTTQSLLWVEIKRRAAMFPKWQWHKPDALDALKADCLHKDLWREDGGYVDKGPFPQPATGVRIQQLNRDPETGEVTLRVMPVHGDVVYWDTGAAATTASARVDGDVIKLSELRASFLTIDSAGVHQVGDPQLWVNTITLRHRLYQFGAEKKCELRAVPPATIRYTTDGSDPKVTGALYENDFIVPRGTTLILAYAERDSIQSEVEQIRVHWDEKREVMVDPQRPVTWSRRQAFATTRESYEFLERLRKFDVQVSGARIIIAGDGAHAREWVDLQTSVDNHHAADQLERVLTVLRELQGEGQVQIETEALRFPAGQDLLGWVEEVKTTLQMGEVKQ